MKKGKVFRYWVPGTFLAIALVAVACQPATPGVTPSPTNTVTGSEATPAGTTSLPLPATSLVARGETTPATATTAPPPTTTNAVPAPDFSLPTLDGQTVTLSALKGRPVMINFWATWCPPCREEMPLLQAIYEENQKDGLVLLAVDIGEDPAVVKKYVEANKLTFTIPLDRDNRVASAYGIRAIPTTVLVDKNGGIRDVRVGAYSNLAQIRNALKKIM